MALFSIVKWPCFGLTKTPPLNAACALLDGPEGDGSRLVLAGPGSLETLWAGDLPSRVEARNRLIGDEEALDLFRRCGLLVLPHVDATQSALISAAYFFRKPVIVTRSGALPEYVQHGQTGYVVEPRNAEQLADRILEVFCDPDRLRAMGEAGHRWYQQQRHLEYQALQNVYAAVVSRH